MIGGSDATDILGAKFIKFVKMMEADPLQSLLVSSFTNSQNVPAGTQLTDIHYEATQYIMAVANAMRNVEVPSQARISSYRVAGDKLENSYDSLVVGAAGSIPTSAVSTTPFVIDVASSSVKELLPGLNAVHSHISQMKNVGGANTATVNLVNYLHRFISLVDLDSLTGGQVVDFLVEHDTLVFGSLVSELENSFGSLVAVGTVSGARDGVINALKAVATKIILALRGVSGVTALNIPNVVGNWSGPVAGGAPATLMALDMESLGVPRATSVAVAKALNNLNNIRAKGTALPATVPVPDTVTTNGLYNYGYMLGIPEVVGGGAPAGAPTGAPGGRKKAPVVAATPGGAVSPDFLYGEPAADGKRYRLDKPQVRDAATSAPTADSEIIVPANGVLLNDVLVTLTGLPIQAVVGILAIKSLAIEGLNLKQDFSGAGNADLPKINARIQEYARKYATVGARLGRIATLDAVELAKSLRNTFVDAFLMGANIVTAGPYLPGNKLTLADANAKELYTLMTTGSDLQTYAKFFNLVDVTDGSVLDLGANIAPADLSKFRLNVKKVEGLQTGGALMRGGVRGDIMFVTILPDYDPATVTGILLSPSVRIDASVLKALPDLREAIRSIFRDVYEAPVGQNQIVILGQSPAINISDILAVVRQRADFSLNWSALYAGLIKRNLDGRVKVASGFSSWESFLKTNITREIATQWHRVDDTDGGYFQRRGPNGEVMAENPVNNCAFLDIGAAECMSFLEDCAYSKDRDTLGAVCAKLADSSFKYNIAQSDIKEKVTNIDPKTAYAILSKFGFGEQLIEDLNAMPRGLRRNVVQSVGSWLKDLSNMADKDVRFGANANAAGGIFEKISNNPTLLNYLEVLVAWVNVNPQVLNPEEHARPAAVFDLPGRSKRYNQYFHLSPYKQAKLNLGSTCGALDRLRSSIENRLAGYDGNAMIRNISGVPLGIEAPFNRAVFSSGVMPNIMYMNGGHDAHSLEAELQAVNNTYGSGIFEQIYKDLSATMDMIKVNEPNRSVRLSNNSRNAIETKLKSIKEVEDALRKSLSNLITKNQIYKASYGQVDAFDVDDSKLPDLLAKHSNLLGLTEAYNRKSINIINLLQTIATALNAKLAKEEPAATTYTRPMRMNPWN